MAEARRPLCPSPAPPSAPEKSHRTLMWLIHIPCPPSFPEEEDSPGGILIFQRPKDVRKDPKKQALLSIPQFTTKPHTP